MFIITRETLRAEIENALKHSTNGTEELRTLKCEIVRLEVERDKKKEEWDRREREVEHKIGLERKRQEFEIEQSKRETTVSIREQNLAADRERFKQQMDFERAHLQKQIESLNKLVEQLLARLPSAEIIATIGGKK